MPTVFLFLQLLTRFLLSPVTISRFFSLKKEANFSQTFSFIIAYCILFSPLNLPFPHSHSPIFDRPLTFSTLVSFSSFTNLVCSSFLFHNELWPSEVKQKSVGVFFATVSNFGYCVRGEYKRGKRSIASKCECPLNKKTFFCCPMRESFELAKSLQEDTGHRAT